MLKNKKILVLLLTAAFVIAVAVYFFIFVKKTAVSPTASPTPAPTLLPTPKYLDTQKYEGLIYEDPNKNFQIVYIPSEKQYQIFINNSPFDKYRTEAENVFLSLLKTSKGEACKLKVEISTPYFVNPNEAGQTYPLSFCSQP